jgi:hypothetical protein
MAGLRYPRLGWWRTIQKNIIQTDNSLEIKLHSYSPPIPYEGKCSAGKDSTREQEQNQSLKLSTTSLLRAMTHCIRLHRLRCFAQPLSSIHQDLVGLGNLPLPRSPIGNQSQTISREARRKAGPQYWPWSPSVRCKQLLFVPRIM